MYSRYPLFQLFGSIVLTLLALTTPAAASCAPDWIAATAKRWCFAFGGTLDADVDQPGAGDEINRVNRQATGPIFGRGDHSLGIGIHYDSFELDEAVAANLDMYRIELRYRLRLGQAIGLHLAPALATSSNRIFEDMAGDDILLQAALTYRWRQPDILAGVVRDARLGDGLRTYPLISVPFSIANSIHGAAGFPDTHFTHDGRHWDYTLRLGPRGYRWHVLDSDGNFRFDVRLRRWELGMTAARRRAPRLFVDAGVAFAREIDFTSSAARRVETGLDPALFVAVGLRLGPPEADKPAQPH